MTSKPIASDPSVDPSGSPAIGSPTSLETLLGLRASNTQTGQAAAQSSPSAQPLQAPPLAKLPSDSDLHVELLFIQAGTPESALALSWMQRMLDGAQLHTARFNDNVTEQVQRYMPHAVFIHFDPLSTDEAAQLASQLHVSHPHLPCVAVGRTKYPQCMLAALRAGVQDFLDVDGPVQAAYQTVIDLIKRVPASAPGMPSAPLTAIMSARAGLGSSLMASHLAWYLQKRMHGTTAIPGKDATPREISNETLDGLLIDLGSPSGDCGLYLGTLGDFDFIEAVNNLRRFDRRLASTGLARHESGLRLLTLPRQPARLRDVSYADADALLLRLRQYFRHIVADLGAVVPTQLAMARGAARQPDLGGLRPERGQRGLHHRAAAPARRAKRSIASACSSSSAGTTASWSWRPRRSPGNCSCRCWPPFPSAGANWSRPSTRASCCPAGCSASPMCRPWTSSPPC